MYNCTAVHVHDCTVLVWCIIIYSIHGTTGTVQYYVLRTITWYSYHGRYQVPPYNYPIPCRYSIIILYGGMVYYSMESFLLRSRLL